MSQIFTDTMQGLLEAVEIEKGNIPLIEKENMPAPTFVAAEKEILLIEKLIEVRKEKNISQTQLANKTGIKQQAISRFEKMENSPSLKFYASLANALGYELTLVKQN